jgi:hypothetical protein
MRIHPFSTSKTTSNIVMLAFPILPGIPKRPKKPKSGARVNIRGETLSQRT